MSLELTNAGERAGDEVVQLYLRDPVASVTRPVKQLAGFLRLPLAPGETPARDVRDRPDAARLLRCGRCALVVEPGEVEVMIGASSADLRARGSFRITGERRELLPAELAAGGAWSEP